jgi:hypothetical protein
LNPKSQDASSPPLAKVEAATAAEVCARFHLDKDAQQLLRPEMSPRAFLDILLEKKQFIAGIDFIAHALPARESIWWGCLCVQHTCGEKLEPWERIACKMAVEWVRQPNEANRAAAQRPAEVLGPTSPAGALAAAANQTGGSLLPPNMPPVPPGPFAPAKSVALAVKVASTKGDALRMQATQRSLVELGIGVAEGRFFSVVE